MKKEVKKTALDNVLEVVGTIAAILVALIISITAVVGLVKLMIWVWTV